MQPGSTPIRRRLMDYDAMRSLNTRDGVAGKVCSRCGQWKALAFYRKKVRFVHSQCKDCQKAVYAASPKKDKREQYRIYNEANTEQRKAYREANRERYVAHAKRYWQEHPEKLREAKRKWANNNRAKASDAHRRWRHNNPAKAFENGYRRRMRLRRAPGRFLLDEWNALKCAYEYTCLACKRREPEIKLVPDHVIPIARGGHNDGDNIQPLCETCNQRKGVKTTDYRDGRDWRVELG